MWSCTLVMKQLWLGCSFLLSLHVTSFLELFLYQDCPVVNATPDDIQGLLGGALFQALFKYFKESGPVYLLPTGPASSLLVVSNPECAKHVLQLSDHPKANLYSKGLVTEVSQFLFGDGFAVACGENWRIRRRAVSPALHRSVAHSLSSVPDCIFGWE